MGSEQDGNNGTNSVRQHPRPDRKEHKSTQRNAAQTQAAPHNPEVGGSKPPPATKNPLESQDSSGFFYFSVKPAEPGGSLFANQYPPTRVPTVLSFVSLLPAPSSRVQTHRALMLPTGRPGAAPQERYLSLCAPPWAGHILPPGCCG